MVWCVWCGVCVRCVGCVSSACGVCVCVCVYSPSHSKLQHSPSCTFFIWKMETQMAKEKKTKQRHPLRTTGQVLMSVPPGAPATPIWGSGSGRPEHPALTFINLHSRESEKAGNSSSYFWTASCWTPRLCSSLRTARSGRWPSRCLPTPSHRSQQWRCGAWPQS